MNLWTNQNIKRYRKKRYLFFNNFYNDFTKAANIRENLVEELLEIYEKMEKYCKYNLFNVIGIEKIDIEKLWVLNRLLKCL